MENLSWKFDFKSELESSNFSLEANKLLLNNSLPLFQQFNGQLDNQQLYQHILEDNQNNTLEGPTNKGLKTHSFITPSGNRIQNLELLQDWLKSNLVCNSCKQGYPMLVKEMNIEGLSSQFLWRCSICQKEFLAPTSPKVKFTGEIGEKPKSTINIMAIGGVMMGGGTFKTLETILGSMDIPSMTHNTFDRLAKYFGEASLQLAVEVMEESAKKEVELAKQNGAITDALNRVGITVSYDGNWAKRSYRHTYNSLLGGGWMIGLYSQLPIAFFTCNKYCAVCTSQVKKKTFEDHDCSKNWEQSAKSMEAEIAIQCTLSLAKLGIKVAVLIGDEDTTTMAQIYKRLPDDLPGTGHSLRDIKKLSDINHIKKIFKKDLLELRDTKWKGKNILTEGAIDHLVHNFSFALKGNKDNLKGIEIALKNVIPHAFGDHLKCSTIGSGDWCKANTPNYLPQLPGNKYLGTQLNEIKKREFQSDLQSAIEKFTTPENLKKLAPCASSQTNESLHGIVGALASKRLFLGRGHQWKYRNAMAGLKKSSGPGYGQQIFRKLNINVGKNTTIWLTKIGNQWRYHKTYKKKTETKLRRNILKIKRKRSNKTLDQQEGVQYESGCGLNQQTTVAENGKKRKVENDISKIGIEKKRRKTGIELEAAKIFKCLCGKSYTTKSSLKKHQTTKKCQISTNVI
jgi:hypothetical protein